MPSPAGAPACRMPPRLREFHFGDWDGLHFAEVADRDPDLSRRYWESPGDVAPPGGESWNQAAARVAAVVAACSAANAGRDIVAVAHFGVILTQIAAASGQTARGRHRPDHRAAVADPHPAGRPAAGRTDQSLPLIEAIPNIRFRYVAGRLYPFRKRRSGMYRHLAIGDSSYSSWSLRGWLLFDAVRHSR